MKNLPKRKMADYVIEEIKKRIEDGRLRQGDKLPNQTEFAQELGVSRLSLREALQTLEQMGVVRQRPKTGTVITVAATDRWAESILPPMLEDAESIFELLRARKVIEGAIAAYASSCADSNDVKKLEQLVNTAEKALARGNMRECIELDIQFHITLMSIPQNRYLTNMYLTVYNRIVQYMSEVFRTAPALWESAIVHHRDIVKAVAAGNVAEVIAAVEKEHDADIRFFESFYQQTGREPDTGAPE